MACGAMPPQNGSSSHCLTQTTKPVHAGLSIHYGLRSPHWIGKPVAGHCKTDSPIKEHRMFVLSSIGLLVHSLPGWQVLVSQTLMMMQNEPSIRHWFTTSIIER